MRVSAIRLEPTKSRPWLRDSIPTEVGKQVQHLNSGLRDLYQP